MERIVFINGEFLPASEAKISIFDRGFLFADSVYEVIPVYKGSVKFLERHLKRLKASLKSIKMAIPNMDWSSVFRELISKNGSDDMQIYLQITRGNQGLRKHDFNPATPATIIAFTIHTPYPTLAQKEKGLSAKLEEDIRWLRCDIKTTAMLANVILNDKAVSDGADTALLIREGYLTEGASSNIFTVDLNGIIRTPPRDHLCLHGITQEITIELIASLGWTLREEMISQDNLMKSQEVWITSTTKEIYPITRINGIVIGAGQGGSYWRQLEIRYQQLIQSTL